MSDHKNGFTVVVARTGFLDEVRESIIEMNPERVLQQADDEEAAIRVATSEFNKTAEKIQTINSDLNLNPHCFGALELWSDDDLIGWEI